MGIPPDAARTPAALPWGHGARGTVRFTRSRRRAMAQTLNTQRVNTVVIGAGQAGLSVGYHLQQRGVDFVILDANARIGDQWRRRWDSLRLFTPARFSSLDGMAFPLPPDAFPTKDQMADYLEHYARTLAL